jgi:hypothetical protein
MSEQEPPEDLIGYAQFTHDAMREVMRRALRRVATEGLPEGHHFYISFLTQAPGVTIHEDLIKKYPNDMTIVLQRQFSDLRISDDFLRVTLTFGGIPRPLVIPFSAIFRFHDPYVHFMLEFEVTAYDDEETEGEDDMAVSASPAPQAEPTPSDAPVTAPSEDSAQKVVSLDRFRKK